VKNKLPGFEKQINLLMQQDKCGHVQSSGVLNPPLCRAVALRPMFADFRGNLQKISPPFNGVVLPISD
jgi:hypothetical protein